MSWGESVPFVTKLGMAVHHHELSCGNGEKNVLLSSASECQRGLVFNHTVLPGLIDGGGVTTSKGVCHTEGCNYSKGVCHTEGV